VISEGTKIQTRQSCLGFSRWSRLQVVKVSRLTTRRRKLVGRKKFRMRLHHQAVAKPTILRSRHQAQDQRNPSRETRSDSVQPFWRHRPREKARETRSYSLARAICAKKGQNAAAPRSRTRRPIWTGGGGISSEFNGLPFPHIYPINRKSLKIKMQNEHPPKKYDSYYSCRIQSSRSMC